MSDSRTTSDRTADEPSPVVNYLPGMPRLSSTPGPVERVVTRLFRRRGALRIVRRRRD